MLLLLPGTDETAPPLGGVILGSAGKEVKSTTEGMKGSWLDSERRTPEISEVDHKSGMFTQPSRYGFEVRVTTS